MILINDVLKIDLVDPLRRLVEILKTDLEVLGLNFKDMN